MEDVEPPNHTLCLETKNKFVLTGSETMDGPSDEEEMTIRAVVDEKYYNETPTVKVYAAILDSPKFISKMVKLLSETSPIPSLQHLKRVKRMGGKSYVILDLVPDQEEEEAVGEGEERPAKRLKLDESLCLKKLKDKGFDYEKSGIVSVEECYVPKYGPKTRVQYEKAMVYWPVNFHPEKKLETMMSEKVFEDSEHHHHVQMMRFVLKKSEEMKKNVALVVDYATREPIAMGYERKEAHPLQHAVMVTVDAVASTYQGGAWELPFEELTFPRKKGVCEKKAVEMVTPEPGEEDLVPYLCTGYDLYVMREPCVMCAMSLVHSRIKRVFFHVRNPEKGALVSKCQIHTIKDLNHHYDVFEMMKG